MSLPDVEYRVLSSIFRQLALFLLSISIYLSRPHVLVQAWVHRGLEMPGGVGAFYPPPDRFGFLLEAREGASDGYRHPLNLKCAWCRQA